MFDFGLYTQVSDSGPHGPLVYYVPEGTSGGILKSHRLSIRPLQIVSQRYLINYGSKFDETSQKDKA